MNSILFCIALTMFSSTSLAAFASIDFEEVAAQLPIAGAKIYSFDGMNNSALDASNEFSKLIFNSGYSEDGFYKRQFTTRADFNEWATCFTSCRSQFLGYTQAEMSALQKYLDLNVINASYHYVGGEWYWSDVRDSDNVIEFFVIGTNGIVVHFKRTLRGN